MFPIYAVINKGNRDTERAVAAYRRKRNLINYYGILG